MQVLDLVIYLAYVGQVGLRSLDGSRFTLCYTNC